MNFLIFLFVFITFSSNSSSNNVSTELYSICENDYVKCLQQLPHAYTQLKGQDTTWYQLKDHEFTALYLLERYDELLVATSKVINQEGLPKEFQFPLTIYHAKALFAQDAKSPLALEYLFKAKELYKQRDSVYVAPRRILLYVNLLLEEAHKLKWTITESEHRAKLKEAYKVLTQAKTDYGDLNHPDFQRILYDYFSKISRELGHLPKALNYQKKAVFWAKQSSNQQTIGVVHYNLARAHQNLNQHSQAISTFNNALDYFIKAKDPVSVIDCNLRMAESYLRLGKKKKFQEHLNKVDVLSKSQPLNKWQRAIKDHILSSS